MHLLGRQPILDINLDLYGHQLLYQSSSASEFHAEAELAIRSVIDDSVLLAGNQSAEKTFLNCTRESLLKGLVTLLPPSTTVLEILGNIEPDEELIECCRGLKILGYSFALKGLIPEVSKSAFFEIADFVKIDFAASSKEERQGLRSHVPGRTIKLIAENVENEPAVEEAWKEGCSFFQGYFFCRPVMTAPRVIPQNHLVYMRLLAELSREPANIEAIEQLAKSEPSICYRLLRLVNSVLYAMPSPVSSIRNAVMLIGEDEFRKLVTVALANIGTSPRAKAATRVALTRAKFCESLAPVLNEPPSALYLLGMLSLMDVILTMPMRQVVDLLPLHSSMKAALLGGLSPLTVALDLVRARESGGWLETTSIQEGLNLRGDMASRFYTEALKWADMVYQVS